MTIWVRSYLVGEAIWWYSMRTASAQQSPKLQKLCYQIAWEKGAIRTFRIRMEFFGTALESSGWYYSHHQPSELPLELDQPGDRVNFHLGGLQLKARRSHDRRDSES